MILANHLRQPLLEPLKERQRMEGFAEGIARTDAIRLAWNARREKAEADGAQFDEPTPESRRG